MGKSIVEQIQKTKVELEKAKKQIVQLKNQEKTILSRNRNEEHKTRTRRLIEKGAILEKSSHNIMLLTMEQLKSYLQQVLQTESALEILDKMIDDNLTQ